MGCGHFTDESLPHTRVAISPQKFRELEGIFSRTKKNRANDLLSRDAPMTFAVEESCQRLHPLT